MVATNSVSAAAVVNVYMHEPSLTIAMFNLQRTPHFQDTQCHLPELNSFNHSTVRRLGCLGGLFTRLRSKLTLSPGCQAEDSRKNCTRTPRAICAPAYRRSAQCTVAQDGRHDCPGRASEKHDVISLRITVRRLDRSLSRRDRPHKGRLFEDQCRAVWCRDGKLALDAMPSSRRFRS